MADGTDLAAQVEGQTVTRWLRRNVAESPDALALRRMRPDGSDVEDWTWARVGDESARLARAFGRLGLARGDRALLFLRNRPEFHLADLGVLLAGGTPLSDLQLLGAGAGRLPGRAQPGPDRRGRRHRLPGAAAQGPRRAAGPARGRGGGRPGRARPGRRAAARRPARRRPGRPGLRRRGGPAGRPGHGDLHLRHHRPAQGRDARPRQHRLAVRRLHRADRRRSRTPARSRTCRWRTSPSGW